ncbi:hypothetical protein MF672_013390 [Actinomadura sp. ATCC 31491]|uniref:Uncharacterized protein n=1 Tax=Actinomadura luzonensis TaxID=2805427 RepID=A0ABT0FR08_9ACTN|nr:hypothetical protein [Actinomadura luzonensis]MCK2214778.1 hypothetical protein [Actinomadura luzonensis]
MVQQILLSALDTPSDRAGTILTVALWIIGFIVFCVVAVVAWGLIGGAFALVWKKIPIIGVAWVIILIALPLLAYIYNIEALWPWAWGNIGVFAVMWFAAGATGAFDD